ncbi:MAG TPA: LytR C-terminal domain-containing protein [Patescibacteria group bacterium]|nr:LytR C-terminal domain-containing protein [Patescibacteria group bacterium]
MADDEKVKTRKRMVVEEVAPTPAEVITEPEVVKEDIVEVPLDVKAAGPEEPAETEEPVATPEVPEEPIKESVEVKEETEVVPEKEIVEVNKVPETNLEDYSKRPAGVNPLIIILPGVLLLGALLGGIVFYQQNTSSTSTETPEPTVTTEATASPTSTPSAKLDLTKYPVAIFNGSGIPGEAGKAKTLLTTAGFNVPTTANAATYDYTKTIIKAKSTVESDFIAKLAETLGKNYVVDKSQTLDSTSKNDIEVIVGASKAE